MNPDIVWEKVIPEAYIVLNPNSAVGRVTGADCNISAQEVAAYASVADHYFNSRSYTSNTAVCMEILKW
jgi:phosphoglycerol geranylgeranyltransferase